MHSTPGMSNWKKWKCPVNNDEISYEKVVLKFTVADELMSLDHFSLMRIFNFLDIF